MVKIDKDEFNQKIFKRIYKLIDEYTLVNENERIAVALSGGKDSVLTLHALSSYRKICGFDFDLVAIAVDEGIECYRASGISSAVNNAKLCNVPLIQESFKDNFEYNLDDIYTNFKSACIPCGVFRRHILNKAAYDWGADKIATGHNLDDEIQSFLMSFARGDTLKFSKFGPELSRIHPKLVPRIKPLWNTPEKEVGLWAIMNDIDIRKRFKALLLEEDTTITDLVNLYNEANPEEPITRQNLTNKLSRQTLQYKELIKLVDVLGYDVTFTKIT